MFVSFDLRHATISFWKKIVKFFLKNFGKKFGKWKFLTFEKNYLNFLFHFIPTYAIGLQVHVKGLRKNLPVLQEGESTPAPSTLLVIRVVLLHTLYGLLNPLILQL